MPSITTLPVPSGTISKSLLDSVVFISLPSINMSSTRIACANQPVPSKYTRSVLSVLKNSVLFVGCASKPLA